MQSEAEASRNPFNTYVTLLQKQKDRVALNDPDNSAFEEFEGSPNNRLRTLSLFLELYRDMFFFLSHGNFIWRRHGLLLFLSPMVLFPSVPPVLEEEKCCLTKFLLLIFIYTMTERKSRNAFRRGPILKMAHDFNLLSCCTVCLVN